MSFDDLCYVHGNQGIEVPVHLNFGQYMLDGLRQFKEQVALVNATTGEEMTYENFVQYSVSLATSLSKLGIGKDDVVAIGSEKRNTILPTALGIIFTGATCTIYSLASGKGALHHELSAAKPKFFICSNVFWELHKDVLASCSHIKAYITFDDGPDRAIPIQTLVVENKNVDMKTFQPASILGQIDTAFILYSSGTTGMPKGVPRTHFDCIVNSLPDLISSNVSLQSYFIFGDWSHNYDLFMSFKVLHAGKVLTYVNDETLSNMLECIEKYQINAALIIPYLIKLITKEENLERFNLDSLKVIYSRGALLHQKTIEKVTQRLPTLQNILQRYGVTECGEVTSDIWAAKGLKPGSVGMAAPNVTIKVVDPKTNLKLGPNQLGEIRITGLTLMKKYIDIDTSSYLDEEGFFKTGDIGYYDNDKYFYIVDRIKDIINNQGHKIAPLELEMLLENHEKVLEASVIGKPDPDRGEIPAAFVVKISESDITEQALVDYITAQVPPIMQLKGGVKFIDKLPRSPRGKIVRQQLREMLNQSP